MTDIQNKSAASVEAFLATSRMIADPAIWLPFYFSNPPAKADKKEPPVFEKLRRFSFECVTDELEDPAEYKEGDSRVQTPEPEKSNR